MASTPNKKEKIADLVKNWDKYGKMQQSEIGEKLGVSGRTIYEWRRELERRGIALELRAEKTSDKSIFDEVAKN